MAEELVDPREVAWHPRFAASVVGHRKALSAFHTAFEAGKPHHAWLVTGPSGLGKATLAYYLAGQILEANGNQTNTQRWIHNRAHPDLAVLERSFNDAKPRKLRNEISVEDAREFIGFFSRTSSLGGWRVGIVDNADELGTEAANAILKLVEEPPARAIIFLLSSQPGRLLRTLRSRCLHLPLKPLSVEETINVINSLPLDSPPESEALREAARLSRGRPGYALQLLNSTGALAFATFAKSTRLDAVSRASVMNTFASRADAVGEFETFSGLLLEWIAEQASSHAATPKGKALAELHSHLLDENAKVVAFNLDRRIAVLDALSRLEHALKAA